MTDTDKRFFRIDPAPDDNGVDLGRDDVVDLLTSIDATLQGVLQRLDLMTQATQSGAQVLGHVFAQLEPVLAGLANNPMVRRLTQQ